MFSFPTIFLIAFMLQLLSPTEVTGSKSENWDHIDKHVLNTPRLTERRVDRLANYFKKVAKTDAEKARAIYRWITDRVTFDRETFFQQNLKPVTGSEVLQSRKAVCSGYVILFRDLARSMRLNVRIIDGHSKGYGFEQHKKSTWLENHSWIAVEIDGVWKLIDPTWGSGYLLADSGEFVPQFTEYYFFTEPNQMIFTHFPRDEQWQLLEQPVSVADYLDLSVTTPFFFQWGFDFGEAPRLYIDTDGKFSTHFTVPESIIVRCLITHTETGQTENVLIQFEKERLNISTVLRHSGEYRLELYARKMNERSEQLKRVVYFYLNNTGRTVLKTYPAIKGSYEMSRASLESPLHYELADASAYNFRINVPRAEEVFLMNSNLQMYYPLEAEGKLFRGNIVPGPGKISLIARFPGKDYFVIMVDYMGVRENRQEAKR